MGIVTMMFALAAAIATAPIACEAVWHDAARDRDLPVRITMPGGRSSMPVVIWSPGLGGDRRSGNVWAHAWAGAGLAVVQMAHPGSDEAVYRPGGSPEERRARISAAITPEQQAERVGDARFVLSELGRRSVEGACDLRRIDTRRAAIAGHSMGAWVAQAIAGQRMGPDGAPMLRDQRFRAAIAFSPTATPGTTAFARVRIPFFVITGSLDGTTATALPAQRAAALAARTAVFESLPADGRKCLLVFADATHMAFAGNRRAVYAGERHVEAISASATIDFLAAALSGGDPSTIAPVALALTAGDRYECR